VSADAAVVAEAMYQAARSATPAKTAETLDELSPSTQRRYLMLAEVAIEAYGSARTPSPSGLPRSAARQLLDLFAESLAYKLNHPNSFNESIRDAFELYAKVVGDDALSAEVKKAMEI